MFANECEKSMMDGCSNVVRMEENVVDLSYYTSIDEATKSWLNSLNYAWGLCK